MFNIIFLQLGFKQNLKTIILKDFKLYSNNHTLKSEVFTIQAGPPRHFPGRRKHGWSLNVHTFEHDRYKCTFRHTGIKEPYKL